MSTETEAEAVLTATPTKNEADKALLAAAIERADPAACTAWIDDAEMSEIVHAVSALPDDDRAQLMELLDPEYAAELVAILPTAQALEALEDIDADAAADIIEELPSDERADLIAALDQDDAAAIMDALEADVAGDVRKLAAYEEDVAGGLMVTEFIAFPETATVRDVLADVEENAERYATWNIQYSYVVDDAGRLRGTIPLRSLLLAKRSLPVSAIMIADPVRVLDTADMDSIREVFSEYNFLGFPVVNESGDLLGVLERSSVEEARQEEAEDLYRQSQGIVGGEELRSMPLLLRSRRRLMWLSANIVLNIVAASVIAFHQETLEAVIALAVFLPIISDMSGCSGNQAVAVSMRELTLGVTRPLDLFRVLRKECAIGIVNGIALGLLIGLVAFAWKQNLYLSLVVGGALALNTLIAVCIGGAVPLILKLMKTDPALAAGPILTTITDMCGFLIVLTLASMTMGYLVGG